MTTLRSVKRKFALVGQIVPFAANLAAPRPILAALLLLSLSPLAGRAVQPDEILPDPALEARARDITRELRCVVCQSESLDESNASIARDLRLMVRERITAGDSDAEVLDYVVARYGEFVLFRPRFNAANAALWLSGPVLLLIGGAVAFGFIRRRATDPTQPSALSPDETARLRGLLSEDR